MATEEARGDELERAPGRVEDYRTRLDTLGLERRRDARATLAGRGVVLESAPRPGGLRGCCVAAGVGRLGGLAAVWLVMQCG